MAVSWPMTTTSAQDAPRDANGDTEDTIHVAVRVRPTLPRENRDICVVRVRGCVLALDLKLHRELGEKEETKEFAFDTCFDSETPQQVLYDQIGAKILRNAFDG